MIPSFSTIISTAKNVDTVFGAVKHKLLNNPTDASVKLGEVLGELGAILDFVEKETVRYLEIHFLNDRSNFVSCRSVLLSLESGYVTIKGYEARGHCHKITNIYEKYLSRWFSKVLDASEAQQIAWLFETMNSADGDMIEGVREITHWLKDESEAVLLLIDLDQLPEANQRIKAARLSIQQTRRNIVEALAQLRLLQASFIVSSQSV